MNLKKIKNMFMMSLTKIPKKQSTNLLINETKNTPRLIFNSKLNEWVIIGRSYPNDAAGFYEPLFKWLDEIQKNKIAHCSFHFRLEYFSTNTSKIFIDLLVKLKTVMKENSMNAILKWYYEEGDEDMRETGASLFEIVKLPFELIETDEYFKGTHA